MELINGDLALQYFTILKGDHLGMKRVEILFFALFVSQTLCKMPWTWQDGRASNY